MYTSTQGEEKKAPDFHKVTTVHTAATSATQRPLEVTGGTTGSNDPTTRHGPADWRGEMVPRPHAIPFAVGTGSSGCSPRAPAGSGVRQINQMPS